VTGIARLLLITFVALVTLVAVLLIMDFHGYFDHGHFTLKHVSWESSRLVAMIAERSDNDAFGSQEDFVVVGDHAYDPAELKRALYNSGVIFDAGTDCLTLRWEGPKRLAIGCRTRIGAGQINYQQRRLGDIVIAYESIPIRSP